jgi:AcrR family transcriptional regulator
MGRPREHDDRVGSALVAAAERIVERQGLEALTVRAVAREAGTTTRAVYSLFGSKDGLVVALGARAFDLLRQGLESLPVTSDPRHDLVDAALMFRRFALDHPALFTIGIQRTSTQRVLWHMFRPTAEEAFAMLRSRFVRLADAGLLVARTPDEAAFSFHALCEGLAVLEQRGVPADVEVDALWRDGIGALVAGLGADVSP